MFFRSWLFVFTLGLLIQTSQAMAQSAAEDMPKQEESTVDANDGSKSQNSNAVDLSPALENIEAAILKLKKTR